MGTSFKNIVWHHGVIGRRERQRINGHGSFALWLTGLSGSGKSSIAVELENRLYHEGIRTYILDGDNIRHGLNNNLGFSPEDRKENLRRVGEVAKLFVDAGVISIAAFISPYNEDRSMVRSMFAANEFIEIYVSCSLEQCEVRDPKGLYKRARAGEIRQFTGISAPYEVPLSPELVVETDKYSVHDCVNLIIGYLKQRCLI
ncbi:adenylylsulfate kinase [Paenibacillus tianmuensis]|uniref:Adenylyl-sulfate kinase n=1 Tax=Paenibacillus tianmuensis TaxID=624147 RepID=A0A1G4TVM9_9BACL|nr:adenylyl-sulfate kinase [Paenibacillus tianmuensis]SCW85463.1 adenylylsulfate kinase [Paenibacillus tianmuensis]